MKFVFPIWSCWALINFSSRNFFSSMIKFKSTCITTIFFKFIKFISFCCYWLCPWFWIRFTRSISTTVFLIKFIYIIFIIIRTSSIASITISFFITMTIVRTRVWMFTIFCYCLITLSIDSVISVITRWISYIIINRNNRICCFSWKIFY